MKKALVLFIFLTLMNAVESTAKKKESFLTFTAGINSVKITDFHSANWGLGYEYRPTHLLGFEFSGFYGNFNHDYYRLDGFMDEIQSSYMLYNGSFGGMKLSNRGYLYFNDNRKIAVFGEYYLGGYYMKSNAEGVYKESELRGNYNSGLKYFHGIAVGTQLALTPKFRVSISIGENSIDFTEALKENIFNNNPNIGIPHTSLSPIVFQFGIMVLL